MHYFLNNARAIKCWRSLGRSEINFSPSYSEIERTIRSSARFPALRASRGQPLQLHPRPILGGRAAGAGSTASPCPCREVGSLAAAPRYGYARHPHPFGARSLGRASQLLLAVPLSQSPANPYPIQSLDEIDDWAFSICFSKFSLSSSSICALLI